VFVETLLLYEEQQANDPEKWQRRGLYAAGVMTFLGIGGVAAAVLVG
jgi:hypothetical protein